MLRLVSPARSVGRVLTHSFTLLNHLVAVANLYYCQPILSTLFPVVWSWLIFPAVDLANAFNVTYDEISVIPTLVQAGCVHALAVHLLTILDTPLVSFSYPHLATLSVDAN